MFKGGENVKKDIYIIKNDINNKVYIGQSVNSKNRFKEHCREKSMTTYIDRIISKIGKEHFWYEILETQVENYNEREKYWINYYKSLAPNGYNVSIGGEGFVGGIDSINSFIKNKDVFNSIILDLRTTNLSYQDIAKKYSIPNDTIICRINTGTSYRQDNLDYPIRKQKANEIITEKKEEEIKNLLKNSHLTFSDIAKKYNISQSYVNSINRGILKFKEDEEYPLRKVTVTKRNLSDFEVAEIYHLLINTKLSLRKIGEKFNCSIDTIRGIKNGTTKIYRREGYIYPLRPNNFKKPVSTISAKESTTTIDT